MTFDTNSTQWLVLHLSPGVGSKRLRQFLSAYDSPEALPELSVEQLQAVGWPEDLARSTLAAARHPWQQLPDLKRLANWCTREACHLLTPAMPGYPWRLLQTLPDPPPVLYVRGDSACLDADQLAVVGSRRPGVPNRQLTRDWCAQLAEQGVLITSGLARGIDAEAHRGALTGGGRTLAVLGSGMDQVYPASHRSLVEEIVDHQGAVISELPPWTPPVAGNFPRRNRLVAALSLAVLVVEGAIRSGSLITARLAAEYGRDVMAVPGHPFYPGCGGTNALIQEGAQLVTTVDDVRYTLGFTRDTVKQNPDPQPADALQVRLLAQIGAEPTALETLADAVGRDPAELYEALMALELSGCIAAQGGCYVRLKR